MIQIHQVVQRTGKRKGEARIEIKASAVEGETRPGWLGKPAEPEVGRGRELPRLRSKYMKGNREARLLAWELPSPPGDWHLKWPSLP